LDKLWQPQNLPNLVGNPAKRAQKNPENREMSSVMKVAGARYEQEKKTLFRAAAYRKTEISHNCHFIYDWNLKIVIGLG